MMCGLELEILEGIARDTTLRYKEILSVSVHVTDESVDVSVEIEDCALKRLKHTQLYDHGLGETEAGRFAESALEEVPEAASKVVLDFLEDCISSPVVKVGLTSEVSDEQAY